VRGKEAMMDMAGGQMVLGGRARTLIKKIETHVKDNFENVSENFANLNTTLTDAGCKFEKPHLIPLFLPFFALPDIRISSNGLVDIKDRVILNTVIS